MVQNFDRENIDEFDEYPFVNIFKQARAWFLRITLSANVCMRVCVSAPEAINN